MTDGKQTRKRSGMRLDTALNKQKRALGRLNDLYYWLELSGMSSAELGARKREIMGTVSGCPRWVASWLEGWADCRQRTIEKELVFFYTLPDGRLASTHRQRDDYYEKLGVGPREVYELATHSGHYWIRKKRVEVDCTDGKKMVNVEVKVPYFVSPMEKKPCPS